MRQAREASVLDDATAEALTSSTTYLPYLQLMAGTSKQVGAGKAVVGDYMLTDGNGSTSLGKSFTVIVMGARACARTFKPSVKSFFDINSAEYIEVVDLSKQKDSNCGHGPEFLFWIPDQQRFATMFLGSATGRNSSDPVMVSFRSGTGRLTVGSKPLKNATHEWLGQAFTPYDHELEYPTDMAELTKVLEDFKSPTSSKTGIEKKAETSERD